MMMMMMMMMIINIIIINTKIICIIVGPDLPLMLQQPTSLKTWGWGFSLFITINSVIISCLSLPVALASYEKENNCTKWQNNTSIIIIIVVL